MKKTEKLFINAATLRVGGGRSVAINFLSVLGERYSEFDFEAVVPNDEIFKKFKFENIKFHFVPAYFHNPLFRLLLDFWIIRKLKKSNVSKVFNMGNVGLPLKTHKQITLFHFPYAIYPNSKVWKKLGIKDYIISKLMVILFKFRIKYSDYILAQTLTAKNRLIKYYNINKDKIFIAPNAISLNNFNKEVEKSNFLEKATSDLASFKCLCLSVYYPHKNIESLLDVADLIKENQYNIQIFITISKNENSKAKKILEEIEIRGLQKILINLDRIPMGKIAYIYSKVDALLLPTILESFTGTYVESMFFKKKIITSDMDFAREICKYNTWFFDPDNPLDILNKILESKKTHNNDEIDKAYNHVLNMPNWEESTERILNIIYKFDD